LKSIIFWLNIILNLLVIGEALALLIGMNFSGLEGEKWLFKKNILIIFLDIIFGLIIFIFILSNKKYNYSALISFLLFLIIVTHLYRDF